jgi:hypothetical protein
MHNRLIFLYQRINKSDGANNHLRKNGICVEAARQKYSKSSEAEITMRNTSKKSEDTLLVP